MERLEREIHRELGRFGASRGETGDGDIVAVVRAWPDAVGETVARNAWPARFARDGTLHVNASSATWAFELGRLAETILEQLRAEIGDSTPDGLRFAPGPVPEPPRDAASRRPIEPPRPSPEHAAAAAEAAAVIDDEELRELVARAAAASLARASREASDSRRF